MLQDSSSTGRAPVSKTGGSQITKTGDKMKFDKVTTFFREVRAEMKSVSWPTKADLKEGTVVVIVMSGITALFLSLVDLGFNNIINLIF